MAASYESFGFIDDQDEDDAVPLMSKFRRFLFAGTPPVPSNSCSKQPATTPVNTSAPQQAKATTNTIPRVGRRPSIRTRTPTPDSMAVANLSDGSRPGTPEFFAAIGHSKPSTIVTTTSLPGLRRPYDPHSPNINSSGMFGEQLFDGEIAKIQSIPYYRELADDNRSISSVSTVGTRHINAIQQIRKIQSKGLSTDYWMSDESVKECFECQSVFTTWRRKHHCRICGQIFCGKCASNLIPSAKYGQSGYMRVCNPCMEVSRDDDVAPPDSVTRFRSNLRQSTTLVISEPLEATANPPQSQWSAEALNFPRKSNLPASRWMSKSVSSLSLTVEEMEEVSSPTPGKINSLMEPSAPVMPFRRGAESFTPQHDSGAIIDNTAIDFTENVGLSCTKATDAILEESLSSALPRSEIQKLSRSRSLSDLSNFYEGQVNLKGQARELSVVLRSHLQKLLVQSIMQSETMNVKKWEGPLMDLLLQATQDIKPATNMYAGEYFRIEKIPGGKPRSSEYVVGIVFMKNVMHKSMARQLTRPRLMLLSFPLSYQRTENQFSILDTLKAGEKEAITNLVERITQLYPHIVLSDTNIPDLAMHLLLKNGIVAARYIPSEVISAIARNTEAEVISSMDRLVFDPKLGRCASFKVQTFGTDAENRRTYLRIEGCNPALGGTLVLRGGSMPLLNKVESIMKTLLLGAYSARLESRFLADEGVAHILSPEPKLDSTISVGDLNTTTSKAFHRTRVHIDESMNPFRTNVFSASPWVRYPPPHPILRMSQLAEKLDTFRKLKNQEEAEQLIRDELGDQTSHPLKPVVSEASLSTLDGIDLNSLTSEQSSTWLIKPERIPLEESLKILEDPIKKAKEFEYEELETAYTEQKAIWDYFVTQTLPSLNIYDYQKLTVLEMQGSIQAEGPCLPPQVRSLEFYCETDISLSDFISQFTSPSGAPCASPECTRYPMHLHHRTFIHGNHRVHIIPENYSIHLQDPAFKNQIVMWSYCKICETDTPQSLMSDDSCRLSFAKFLELSFYGDNFYPASRRCGHNSYTDHVRYWMANEVCIRVVVDRVSVNDVQSPRRIVTVDPQKRLEMRNDEFTTVLRKSHLFWDSVVRRIELFDYSIVPAENLEEAHTEMDDFRMKCEADRLSITKLLHKTYQDENPMSGSEMTNVRRVLQTKAVDWATAFAAFESKNFPPEKDVRRLTTTAPLKRFFTDTSLSSPASPERRASSISGQSAGSITPFTEGPDPFSSSGEGEKKTPATESESESVKCSTIEQESTDDTSGKGNTIKLSSAALSMIPNSSRRDSSGNESDSTVCADNTLKQDQVRQMLTVSEDVGHMSGVDTDYESKAPKRPAVSELVNFFSDPDAHAKKGAASSPEQSTPLLRATELRKQQDKKPTLQTLFDPPSTSRPSIFLVHKPTKSKDNLLTPNRVGRGISSSRASRPTSRPPSRPASRPPSRIDHAEESKIPRKSRVINSGKESDSYEEPNLFRRRNPRDIELGLGLSRPTASTANKRVSRVPPPTPTGRRVAAMASQYNKLVEDRQNRFGYKGSSRPRPVGTAVPKVMIYHNVKDAVKEDSDDDSDDKSQRADDENEADDEQGNKSDDGVRRPLTKEALDAAQVALNAHSIGPSFSSTFSVHDAQLHHPIDFAPKTTDSSIGGVPSDVDYFNSISPSPRVDSGTLSSRYQESDNTDRGSIMRAISNLWSYRGADFTPLEYPLDATEHIFADNPILLRETEPSSILAFCLSSPEYHKQLHEAMQSSRDIIEKSEDFMPDDASHPDDKSWGVIDLVKPEGETEVTYKRPEAKHFNLEFEEGTTKFNCKIFFAEQFDTLRQNCGCGDQFVESLARCIKWESSGGKSKVIFMKTKDDRFIIKEISRMELDSLLGFAPAYFDYMSRAIFQKSPTILAKIFGFYRFKLENTATSKLLKIDVVVMENLFYQHKPDLVYDLKGSTRNRFVETKGKGDVLMDENFVKASNTNPILVRENSKRFLAAAVFNDSHFLAKFNVMDYSLVVGINEEQQQLVVGIVDFIRTYTWDKKLESWVKDSTFLGVGRSSKPGGPTIVTPKQYKTRFREAIDRYFLLAPDPWLQATTLILPPKEEPDDFYLSNPNVDVSVDEEGTEKGTPAPSLFRVNRG